VSRIGNPHLATVPPGGGRAAPGGLRGWVLTRPLLAYFAAAYALTALAAVVVYGPTVLGHDTPSGQAGRALAVFPLMVIGVGAAGVTLTTITAGRRGRRQLWARMRPGQAAARWYAVVLLPPAAILTVLLGLHGAVSTALAPGRNRYGLAFGLLAGFSEELGWTGYAWPRLRPRFRSTLGAGATLGLGWGLWHLPVIDHLGVHPHGVYWTPFAAAFIAAVAALRVLIAWAYSHTGSLLVAQLLHASSTGSLVLFSPLAITSGQEALWYASVGLQPAPSR
jgi:membrane protease YdiL (CAAX protease family)